MLADVPGVVRVRNGPLTDVRIHFFAMEYLAGGTLHGEVLGGRLDRQQALAAVLAIGRVLQAAHQRNILHRDVKPANILLDGEKHAYLTDFDLTQIGQNTHASVHGQPKGTFGFAPPELLKGEQGNHRADVYSLGMTVLFVLLGRDDLFATGLSATELIQQLDESSEVKDVLRRATDRNPDRRYASIQIFCDDLKEALEQTNPQQPIILPSVVEDARHEPALAQVPPHSAQQRPPKLLPAPSPSASQSDSAQVGPGGMPQGRSTAESSGIPAPPLPTPAVQPSVSVDAATTAAPSTTGNTVSSPSSAIPTVESLVSKPMHDSVPNTGRIGPRRLTNKREQVILIGVGLGALVTGLGIGAVLTRSLAAGGVAALEIGKTDKRDAQAEPPADLQAGQGPVSKPLGDAGVSIEPFGPKPTSPSPPPDHQSP